MVNQTQKHYLITGATSGIGQATAIQLAKTDAQIVIVGRNEEKCRQTVSIIHETANNKTVGYIVGDLSRVADCIAVAKAYRAKYQRLDVLINNAGGLFGQRQVSHDGLEMNIAINYLSSFILSMQLQDLLQETATHFGEARIVNVTSSAHGTGIFWDDLQFEQQSYSMFKAYGQSKAMMIIFTQEMAKRLGTSSLTINAVHPGSVRTDIGNKSGNAFFKVMLRVMGRFFLSPEQAADGICHVALASELKGVTGKYFEKKKMVTPKPSVHNSPDGARLWDASTKWSLQTS